MQKLIYSFCFLVLVCACSTINCPLNNSVYAKYKLAGSVGSLVDTLTVMSHRNTTGDTILLNQLVARDSFELPLSFSGTEDVLFFILKDTLNREHRDTITIKKQNEPHFESVDCNPTFFHIIERVSHTQNKIDSIVIQNNRVTNDNSKAHFSIYFKSNI